MNRSFFGNSRKIGDKVRKAFFNNKLKGVFYYKFSSYSNNIRLFILIFIYSYISPIIVGAPLWMYY